MTRKDISDGVGNISTRHIQEAASYMAAEKKVSFFKKPFGRSMIAAVLALCILAGGISIFSPFGGMVVTAYAHGTDEEITQAGAVINTGTISDSGEMTGHPLMFYLSGKDISTVRFSCKNQQINFMDWTEKRDEFGLAQNFTVSYGEDESEYYYLLIDWVPNATIRELTDNANSTIAALPQELREDVIVMEITFENGKTLTKAITVSLLEDGTFFAKFGDYEITAEDDFVKRPDSKSILREILYAQGSGTALSEEYPLDNAPVIEGDYKDADPTEPETIIVPGEITFTGTIVDHTIESLAYIILVDVDENSGLTYDKVLFELTDNQKMWESKIGARVQIVCSDTFQESRPPIGDLISIEEVDGTVTNNSLDTAKMTAQDYYTNSVFEVVSMELKSQTAEEISFSVCVSKGGVIQEPNRTIFLQLINDAWEVVNEGY